MSDFTREDLLASAETVSTYFMDFNSKCNEFGVSYVYCFVENYDLCFYPHRVEDILGRKAAGIPCDGKNNVLLVYALVKSKPEYEKYTTRFFVDADFDDNSTIDSHIYVTTCYSIENLFVEEEVVSRILENEFKIRPNTPDGKHRLCLDLFKKELNCFNNSVLLYNAWYRGVKKKGLTKEMRVCLGDSVPSSMMNLSIGAINPYYTKATMEGMYPLAPKLTEEEIIDSILYLRTDYRRLRGKFEIQFLHSFLNFLNADALGKKEYSVLSRGVYNDRKHLISNYEKYVSTPADLRSYILTGVRLIS